MKCKNDLNSTYTGKEPSPKGLGYSSKKERIGTKKRGKDGNMWIVKKRIDGVKLWTRFSSKKVTKKKIIKKYKMRGGNIATIRTNTEAFCNGIGLDWFLNDNETLLTEGRPGIGNLVKSDDDMTKFTQSACILSSSDKSFTSLLETIRTNDRYIPHLGGVADIGQMVKRLIYNRPLAFVGRNNSSKNVGTPNMIAPGNPNALDHIGGLFEPYVKNGPEEKYELISLAALVGCWSLTPIVHSGIKSLPHISKPNDLNERRLREEKFFNGNKNNGNFNTEAYVCGLVGARFEKSNQMEDAYIRETAAKNNPIHRGLRTLFEERIGLNNKYKHTYGGSQSAINKHNLYRERIRFTFELFLGQCFNIAITKKEKLCPVFTGLGGGVWVQGSGMSNSDINNIIEDVILSILTDNQHYLEVFPAIRISSIISYPDILGDDMESGLPIQQLRLGSVSEEFNTKYRTNYSNLINGNLKIFHTHYNNNSPQSFFTQEELNQLIGIDNVRQAFLFAWDGNSFVGNEYWYKDMSGSGDPLTVSSCCIGQLCNPFINHSMLDRIEPIINERIITVNKGNTTGNYAIKVGDIEFPVRNTSLGKKRFIEKVVIEIHKNPIPQQFICPKDEFKNNWEDKIVWNGNNYIYHDSKRKSEGIVIIKKMPTGLTESSSKEPFNYEVGDKVMYTSSQGFGDYPGIIKSISDTTIDVLLNTGTTKQIKKASNMMRLSLLERPQDTPNQRVNKILSNFTNIPNDQKNGYKSILKQQIKHNSKVTNNQLKNTIKQFLTL